MDELGSEDVARRHVMVVAQGQRDPGDAIPQQAEGSGLAGAAAEELALRFWSAGRRS